MLCDWGKFSATCYIVPSSISISPISYQSSKEYEAGNKRQQKDNTNWICKCKEHTLAKHWTPNGALKESKEPQEKNKGN